jgi:phosphoribosyl 1,2-cyclic phosphate phosphodiesterase
MKVTVLGCGASAGVPMVGGTDGAGDWGLCDPRETRNRRTRSSIVVESETGERLLVDTSPDLREQLLNCRVPRIDSILYTHAHADHIAGIDDVRILNRIIQRPLQVLANQATLDEITRRFAYAFAPWSGPGFYRPVLASQRVEAGEIVETAGLSVRLFAQGHGRVQTLGLRIGGFGYSTDVVTLDEAAFAALKGVDTWLVDCFLRKEAHWTHAHLALVLEWVARVRPRRTVLTHMGTEMDWAWMQENLPDGVEAGYDGMVIDVTGPGSSTASSLG